MLWWSQKTCVRDECTYEKMSNAILNGKGIISTMGWLWAPAYPALMAIMQKLTGYAGTVQILQLVAAVLTQLLVCLLTRQMIDRQDGRATRIASWLYALNPTFIFYTSSDWSETLYGLVLLAAVVMLGRSRGDLKDPLWGDRPILVGPWTPFLAGAMIGICVLFRGVATYLLPIFAIGMLWGRWRSREAWVSVVSCILACVLTVAPYSIYASQKFGGLVISDRTLGQMMWMGNNSFPPMTFDYGNGLLNKKAYQEIEASGRPHCDSKNPVVRDSCEVNNGITWIKEHPKEFILRIPLRVAQMFNPHSFLTRNLRWDRWSGMPSAIDEFLVLNVVIFSFLNLIGGTAGWFARVAGPRDPERGVHSWYPFISGVIVLYHIAAIAVTAGLSRYRVPLEPLWLVLAAGVFAYPQKELDGIAANNGRLFSFFAVSGVLILLMLRFLPTGWSWWHSW